MTSIFHATPMPNIVIPLGISRKVNNQREIPSGMTSLWIIVMLKNFIGSAVEIA
ncbi:hypothetical protein [Flavobacterium sp.]|uniref:hypothetical protein n=1 Tax=Flavobacterium sp. TaxID=239 RepID=UPI002BFD9306|nr:hypothetical protein [Flavobacterium sp.]HSD08079.1 hypothetical protein [Flavobacterium sp.]